MKKLFKKIFSMLCYATFFCSLSYILFICLLRGFLSYGLESKEKVIMALLFSATLAISLPAIICYQHYKLEELVDAVFAAYPEI